MLCLTRKVGERIRIGDDIWVVVLKKRNDGKLSIGIDAPREINVVREELIQDAGLVRRRVFVPETPTEDSEIRNTAVALARCQAEQAGGRY